MNADDPPLMPYVGELSSARLAIALARISAGPAAEGEVPDIDEAQLPGIVVVLSNLCASLARLVVVQQKRNPGGEHLTADGLLAIYLHDQEVRAARAELGWLDDGLPW